MSEHIIMDEVALHRCIVRLSHEIEERCEGLENVVLLGMKAGGGAVARRIADYFARSQDTLVPCAGLEEAETCGVLTDGKCVVLCDTVLYTGKTAIEGVETLFRLGRPARIQLLVLIDRGGRKLPVRADFVGKNVPTSRHERVEVRLKELGAAADAIAITGGKT